MVVSGWQEAASASALDLLRAWAEMGVRTLLYTDVRRDGTLKGLDREVVARVRAASTPMDYLVLVVVFVSALTGVLTAVLYRYGSFWFPAVMTPYLWSVLTLSPRPELLQDLPFWTKLHVFNFWVFLALFPFSRLVHIVTVPLGYVVRPWQIVVWVRRTARRETL